MNEIIKVSSLGEKNKRLIIDDKVFSFNDQKIPFNQVTGLKYGVSLMPFYRFSVGRKYHIGLKTPTDQVDLVLRSYFRMSNSYLQSIYNQIIELIWEPVTDQLLSQSMDLLLTGQTFGVGNCRISKAGIVINKDAGLTKKPQLISWDDLSYEEKYDRLVLNSKNNQSIWTNLYFLDNWNVDILMAILDWLYKEDGLAELSK